LPGRTAARIFEVAARHAAVRARLVSTGIAEETADAWIGAWEAQAARDGLERGSAYWGDVAWSWIAEERRRRRMP
jgi:hypothetical protein